MMIHYIIDGNNLIGKMNNIRSKDRNSDREKLAFILERFFSNKKVKVTLHFDGHKNLPIKVSGMKIIYSEKLSADEMIKEEIERASNRKNITLISSDKNLKEFAHVCSCGVKNSEDFIREINSSKSGDDEDQIIESMKNSDEFKKLFGVE